MSGGSEGRERVGCQAVPKSAREAGPETEERRMLEGLMSRWRMEEAWRWVRAAKRSVKIVRVWVLRRGVPVERMCARVRGR